MVIHYMRVGLITITAGIALSPALVYGDDTHYNNIIIGERASGMGGAYTAISDDPSGLYYNPAGTVYAGSRNFTASVNALHRTEVRYKSVIGGKDWVRKSSNLLPNFFGATQPMMGGMAGFSYAVTDSIVEDQDFTMFNPTSSVTQYTYNLNVRDNTTKIGPSFAKAITDSLSLGVTLYGHIRESKTINNRWYSSLSSTSPTGFDHWWANSYFETSELGVNPVLGIMWSPADKVSIGMSVRKTAIISSTWTIQGTLLDTAAPGTGSVYNPPMSVSGDQKREHPVITSLGIGYFPSNKLLLSADLTYHTATDGVSDPRVYGWLYNPREATWNASCGIEYFPTGSWALRTGLFTNRSNTPVISADKEGQEDHYDMYGFSGSLTKLTPSSSLTAGITYSWGEGDSQPYGDSTIKTVEADSLTLFLSSSYNY